MSAQDYMAIVKISQDPQFLEAMIDLKEKDQIEYQLKMSQFKTQFAQNKQKSSNQPKCPTCQSTNIKKISATSKVTNTVMWGIFGTKRHKTYHCNNCGYEW